MKNKGCLIGVGILVVVALIFFWGVGISNSIKTTDQAVQKQWSNVENTYQKRADLIPNLVNTVKGAANMEKETLTAVIDARAKATSNQIKIDDASQLTDENIAKFQAAQDQLGSTLSRLLVSVERYPDIKFNQNFTSLQAELSSIEQEVLFERKKYNDEAEKFNSMIVTFPNSFIAGFTGATKKGYFKAAAGSENVPKVEF